MNIINLVGYGRSGTHCVCKWLKNDKTIEVFRNEIFGNINIYINEFKGHNVKTVFLVRDWYNHEVSSIYLLHEGQIKSGKINNWYDIEKRREHYKKMYLLYKKHPEKIILYNRWFTSKKYRNDIIKTLNLTFYNANLSFVNSGETSIGKDFDNSDVKQLKVLERYKMNYDKLHNYKIYDKEINKMTKEMFGEDVYDFDIIEQKFNPLNNSI